MSNNIVGSTISTGNGINSCSTDKNDEVFDRIFNHFKKCDDDPANIKCLHCSQNICNKPTISALHNHLKSKHSIDETKTTSAVTTITTTTAATAGDPNIKASSKRTNNNNNITNGNSLKPSRQTSTNNTIVQAGYRDEPIKAREKQPSYINNMTRTQQHFQSSTKTKSATKSNSTNSGLRRNLDLVDYNELLVTSMKPSPSASVSKNLMSRLNQLSLPVTRKLRFWNKKSFQVNQYDPSFKVIYLGNLGMQLWSKDESCLEKPLSALWNNYLVNMKTEIVMRLTICNSGLKAITRQHGLTQYWSNRLVYCCSHKNYPKTFSWIYRHEGKKMRQELRCHAVFCSSPEKAAKMVTLLNQRLACALQEFRREKKSCGPSFVTNDNPSILVQQRLPRTIPLRRQILAKGSANFRPPLERSKSAPKLSAIKEEDIDPEEGDEEDESHDEYEFEQSFGELEDDDDDDGDNSVEDYGLVIQSFDLNVDDGEVDSVHRMESNSLATTVNEETSNSSVHVIGDNSYDNNSKQHVSQRDKLDAEDSEEKSLGDDALSSIMNISNISSYHSQEPSKKIPTYNDNSSLETNDKIITNYNTSQQEGENRNPSANNTHQQYSSSSKTKKDILSNYRSTNNKYDDGADNEDDDDKFVRTTTGNTSSKELTQQQRSTPTTTATTTTGQADDAPTQEITLAWSNLVIK